MSRTPGSPKTGGRKKGSLDKAQRVVVTAEIAQDILDVYQLLGGPSYLYKWAKENPKDFILGPLARLMPAAPKDDAEGATFNTQFNFDANPVEIARRVAFVLARGMAADMAKDVSLQEPTPQEACRVEPKEPRWTEPTPVYEGESLTPEEVAAMAKKAEAERIANLEHRGSAAERGLARGSVGGAAAAPRRSGIPPGLKKGRELL